MSKPQFSLKDGEKSIFTIKCECGSEMELQLPVGDIIKQVSKNNGKRIAEELKKKMDDKQLAPDWKYIKKTRMNEIIDEVCAVKKDAI